MKKYIITLGNGHSETIEAKSLRSAKAQATRMANFWTKGCSVQDPDGTLHNREFWDCFGSFGWKPWRQCN